MISSYRRHFLPSVNCDSVVRKTPNRSPLSSFSDKQFPNLRSVQKVTYIVPIPRCPLLSQPQNTNKKQYCPNSFYMHPIISNHFSCEWIKWSISLFLVTLKVKISKYINSLSNFYGAIYAFDLLKMSIINQILFHGLLKLHMIWSFKEFLKSCKDSLM